MLKRIFICFSIFFFINTIQGILLADDASKKDINNTINFNDYKEECGTIWGLKSLVVKEEGIFIEFNRYAVIPAENFFLKIGEGIKWGDGDHFFVSITLDYIKNGVAFVTYEQESRPPPGLANRDGKSTRKCKCSGIIF